MIDSKKALCALLAASLAACSDPSTLAIQARAPLADSAGLAGMVLRIGGREIRADDFRPDAAGIPEVLLEVPDEGRLRVDAQLSQGGQVVAEGTVSWDLVGNEYEWVLDVFRQADDPTELCFGCAGKERIAIAAGAQGEPNESLWFAWGGKPKGSDIVY